MKILVLGGTGTVGSHLVQALLAKGEKVRIMTSSPDKLASLPQGVEGMLGNLEDPASLPAAFEGVDAVFILNALSPSETEQGLAAVEAAKNAGTKRIVYLSVHNLEQAKHVGHFGKKIPVEEAIKNSGIPYTILAPNNYFQNDFWFRDVIAGYKVYPQPIGGKGLHRVDVRDIADAAVNALTSDAYAGKTYALNGPDRLTGEDVAATFSKHLGFDVHYAGDDLESWEAQSLQYQPEWLVKDLKAMYRHFQDHGFTAIAEELEMQREIIGHEPRSFDSFVAEIAPSFRN